MGLRIDFEVETGELGAEEQMEGEEGEEAREEKKEEKGE